ncbi:MAG: 23S rRNA (uracil(1939)-C(5))-methyltransferase RlmD [Acholeplasmatales bacterium]|nr:23S rRNA (uracil(1939)-C(5))-methyltransferase RlmD [Acholeplasmatales bacterium]
MQKTELKVGQEVIVDIKRLGINGEGIAFYKKLAIFVENAIPGEGINVKITKVLDKMAFADVVNYKHTSEYRVEPECPCYKECGGCNVLHIDYNKMLEFKREAVVEAISRYTKLNPKSFEIKNTYGMENYKNYRYKSQLQAFEYNGKLNLGLVNSKTLKGVDIARCHNQNEIVNDINIKIVKVLNELGLTPYNPETKQGDIRNVVVRVSHFNQEAQVTLVYAYKNLEFKLNKAAKEISKIDHVVTVAKSYHDTYDDGLVIQKECVVLQGKKTITETIGKFKFELSPESFFQLNPVQTEHLYDFALKAAKLSRKENILDLYCGAGTIGIYMSKMAQKVIGVELNPEAVKNAIENAKRNKVQNAEYYAGSVYEVLPQLAKKNINIDVLVCDPPRMGLGRDVCKTILDNEFKRIVYVSCNPATLAKDLDLLSLKYSIKYIQPVDMFPGTSHVETVVSMTHK